MGGTPALAGCPQTHSAEGFVEAQEKRLGTQAPWRLRALTQATVLTPSLGSRDGSLTILRQGSGLCGLWAQPMHACVSGEPFPHFYMV